MDFALFRKTASSGNIGFTVETDMRCYWRDHHILRMSPISNR